MKSQQFPYVDRRDAVTIGEAERLVGLKERRDRLQSPAGHGIAAGLDQRDPPGLAPILMDLHRIVREIDRNVRGMEEGVSRKSVGAGKSGVRVELGGGRKL